MSRKSVLLVLFLLVSLVVPSPARAQSSFKINKEFLGKTLTHDNQLDTDLCGSLEITGGTGWLYIELTLSAYYHFYKRIHAAYRGKDVLDSVYVDCDPYYLPDIFLQYSGHKQEPTPAVEGQPIKYFFKAKLGMKGQDLKPFVMKICRGAMGYWYNSLKFIQLAQVVGLEAHWVPGDEEPENPIGTPPPPVDPTGAEGQVWEAESLNPVYSEGCSGLVQQMEGFGNSWSQDAHLFCAGPRGGTVTLPFRVDKTSAGELSVYMTVAPDFAIAEFLLDGKPVGVPLDTYAPAVASSGKISLGNVTLAQGVHKLTVKMVGWNPKMEGDGKFGRLGIDYIYFKF